MAIVRLASQNKAAVSATSSVSAVQAATPAIYSTTIAVVYADVTGANVAISGFTQDATQNSASTHSISIFSRINAGTESATVTATATSATVMGICVSQYTGVMSASTPVDQVVTAAAGSASSMSPGTTGTTAQWNELCIVGVGLEGNVTAPTYTGGFTAVQAGVRTLNGELIVTAKGTQTQRWDGLRLE